MFLKDHTQNPSSLIIMGNKPTAPENRNNDYIRNNNKSSNKRVVNNRP